MSTETEKQKAIKTLKGIFEKNDYRVYGKILKNQPSGNQVIQLLTIDVDHNEIWNLQFYLQQILDVKYNHTYGGVNAFNDLVSTVHELSRQIYGDGELTKSGFMKGGFNQLTLIQSI